MKKIRGLCSIVLILSMLFCFSAVRAEEQELENFDELMGNLLMENHFPQEQIKTMYNEWIDKETKYTMESYIPTMRKAGKYSNLTDEEACKEYMEYYCTLMGKDNGMLFTLINRKYFCQYIRSGNIDYLLSDNRYWTLGRWPVVYSENGESITEFFAGDYGVVDPRIVDSLKTPRSFEEDLLSYGENRIEKVALFHVSHSLSFLYIKGEKGEYLAKVWASASGRTIMPNLELGKLYPATTILDNLLDNSNSDVSAKGSIVSNTNKTKPTFDAEAESLQSDGLLYGNEKGLDLLKPLTRIEATAILVRAMGYENANTEKVSYFSDIPSDNWGAKYANIARDKGIAAGVGDGLFAPDDTITASQFATLILRNMGENPDWQTAINIFVEQGLITSEQAEKMDLFTRGDMAKIIYEAKQKGLF